MKPTSGAGFLRSVELRREAVSSFEEYPFCLPVVRNLDRLDFDPRVTFIVGDNGTGKSTLLEAIAVAFGFNPEGGTRNFSFSTRDSHSTLHDYIKLIRGHTRPYTGFFLRAESMYNMATYIDQVDVSHAYGGQSLHTLSHGESFMALLEHRFTGDGLYILDEPEAALSPTRQMTFLTCLHDLVRDSAQFVIATHSPIIMAYPHATLYVLSEDRIEKRAYKETEHFQVARNFLTHTDSMLRELLED
jgi:predicted ATPase